MSKFRNSVTAAWGTILVLTALLGQTHAEGVSDFYRGKQVTLIVGYGTGGGYDVYARVLAKYLGRHIPGAPSVIVQNMPGAGSLRAANYLFSTAPKDGTQIGTFARDMPLLGILKSNPNVKFDPRQYTWLGSSSSYGNDAYLLWVRKDSGFKTIEDVRRPGGKKLILGGTAEGATGNDVSLLLKETLGLNLQLVTGYPDSSALFLAVDRKEIDGRFVGISAVSSSKPDWMAPDSNMTTLMQFARRTRHPNYPDAPTARELAPNDRARAMIEIAEMPYLLSRPFVAPPGVPADRAKALEAAFMAANSDPDYLNEANRMHIDISPLDGSAVLSILGRISESPADVLDEMRAAKSTSKD
jgi:tripartite-type tricarboxylate transporter receptor subunit TctC